MLAFAPTRPISVAMDNQSASSPGFYSFDSTFNFHSGSRGYTLPGDAYTINPSDLTDSTPRTTIDVHSLIPELQKQTRRMSIQPLDLSAASSFDMPMGMTTEDPQYAFAYGDNSYPVGCSPLSAEPVTTPASFSSPGSTSSTPARSMTWATNPNQFGHKVQRSLSTGELSALYTQHDVRTISPEQASYNLTSLPPMPHSAPIIRENAGIEPVPVKSGNLNAGAFVYKLYNMLADPEHQDLICFTTAGTSFIVSNAAVFAQRVLPKHFKHSNFSSFVRQCNMYGFHKVNKTPRGQRGASDAQICEFSHPKFIRGQPDLLDSIKRRAVDDSDTASPLPSPNPSSSSLVSDNASASGFFATPRLQPPAPVISLAVPRGSQSSMGSPVRKGSESSQASFHEDALLQRIHALENALKLTQMQNSDLSRHIGMLQSTCASLQRVLQESLQKQDTLTDLVGNMFNHMQTSANGTLGFGFPVELTEPALPMFKDAFNKNSQQRSSATPFLGTSTPSTTPMMGGPTPAVRFESPSPFLAQSRNNTPMAQSQPQFDLMGLGVQYDQRPPSLRMDQTGLQPPHYMHNAQR